MCTQHRKRNHYSIVTLHITCTLWWVDVDRSATIKFSLDHDLNFLTLSFLKRYAGAWWDEVYIGIFFFINISHTLSSLSPTSNYRQWVTPINQAFIHPTDQYIRSNVRSIARSFIHSFNRSSGNVSIHINARLYATRCDPLCWKSESTKWSVRTGLVWPSEIYTILNEKSFPF